jgi:hypothetical protein
MQAAGQGGSVHPLELSAREQGGGRNHDSRFSLRGLADRFGVSHRQTFRILKGGEQVKLRIAEGL